MKAWAQRPVTQVGAMPTVYGCSLFTDALPDRGGKKIARYFSTHLVEYVCGFIMLLSMLLFTPKGDGCMLLATKDKICTHKAQNLVRRLF